jgi:TolB-like protein
MPIPAHEQASWKHKQSILVLPFDDLSPGGDNEYFSDGLTEEIITDLSRIEDLRVISRSSAMTFKGTKKTIALIAGDLDVQYVLEGSVRKSGDNVRITAQLIDATSDAHMWSRMYGGALDDVFDIQERVARAIVDALELTLKPGERKTIAERPVDDARAYECYLRARQEVRRWTPDGLKRALQHFQNGLDIIGDNALLYAGIGSIYWWNFNMGIQTDDEYLRQAEAYAKKVFELDPDSRHGHRLLGLIAIHRGDYREIADHLRKAVDADPNDTEALVFLSIECCYWGKGAAALPLIDRLLEIDPLSPTNYFPVVMYHTMEGQFATALERCRMMHRMGSGVPLIEFTYARTLLYNHRTNEAHEVLSQLIDGDYEVYPIRLGAFLKHALQKNDKAAIEAIGPLVERQAKLDAEIAWVLADGFALMGDKERALDWLETAVSRGLINYPFLSDHDPFLAGIRSEERFKRLMQRVKSEWEGFVV